MSATLFAVYGFLIVVASLVGIRDTWALVVEVHRLRALSPVMMHHLYRRQGVLYDGWSTHSEGASSSVPVELVEMTLPVAGCLVMTFQETLFVFSWRYDFPLFAVLAEDLCPTEVSDANITSCPHCLIGCMKPFNFNTTDAIHLVTSI
ncbi:hypothetical protein MG293_003276 [Ovis ammon polii]|uniref:Uncharacterized protein n=1 Tax=Ovis ammon polii TaxID=230172 RepID=A0AAD4UK49_OVIAM|nr:hypothetical protein MG293_003276 [Ovis ammon polii]